MDSNIAVLICLVFGSFAFMVWAIIILADRVNKLETRVKAMEMAAKMKAFMQTPDHR